MDYISILLITSLLLLLFYLIYYYIKAFCIWNKTIPTQKINENLFCIKTKTAQFYIINLGNEFIIIDTGDLKDQNRLKQEFEKIRIAMDTINAIFLTHSDYDHVSGLDFFHNAKIYASEKERPLFERTKPRLSFFYYNKKIKNEINYLKEGEIVKFGEIRIQIYETPGHTIGHAIFIVSINNDKNSPYLFSGDSFNIKNGKAVMNYRINTTNPKQAKKSIQKIASFESIKLLCTSHFGIYDDFPSVFEDWR